MEAVGPEVYGEAEQRERWVDADLRRIAGDAEEEGGDEEEEGGGVALHDEARPGG